MRKMGPVTGELETSLLADLRGLGQGTANSSTSANLARRYGHDPRVVEYLQKALLSPLAISPDCSGCSV